MGTIRDNQRSAAARAVARAPFVPSFALDGEIQKNLFLLPARSLASDDRSTIRAEQRAAGVWTSVK
jgi:hypothetical protein